MSKLIDTTNEAAAKATETAVKVKQWDERRSDFPAEHLIVAAAGLAMLMVAGNARSPFKKLLFTAVGTAALTRAASGRGGVARIAGWIVGK